MIMAEKNMNQLTLFAEDFLAKTSAPLSEETVLDWLEVEQDYGDECLKSSNMRCLDGLYSKTFRAYSIAMMGETLPPLFRGWLTSGMAFVGGYWTQDTLESLTDDEECSLLPVFLTLEVHQKYYLDQTKSAKFYRENKKKEIDSRCVSDGTVDFPLSDLDNVFLRKLTPLEQERVMGFPENWTNTDTEQ